MSEDTSVIFYEACPVCSFPISGCPELRRADCSKHVMFQEGLPNVLVWLRCGRCGHMFRESFLSKFGEALLFENVQENQTMGWDLERQRLIAGRIVHRVYKYRSAGFWLDVGFGNGALIFAAHEFGYQTVGIDLRPQSVERLKSCGFEAFCGGLEDLHVPEVFDVVSLADVLEHMPFPMHYLEIVYGRMVLGGILFLSLPNVSSFYWAQTTRDNTNPYWSELEHYHNWERGTLISCLERTGFQIVDLAFSERYRMCIEIIARRV